MAGDQGNDQELENVIWGPDEDDQDLDLDSPDGFRKSVKRKMKKLLCVSQRSKSGEGDDGAAGNSSARLGSTSSSDFSENKTAFVASQAKKHQAGGDDDSDEYDFTHPKRGVAVIINNEDFSSCKDFDNRPGSAYDATALCKAFKHLGFDIIPYKDLPAWKMVEVLKTAAATYDHRNADCFSCTILSHGDQTWSLSEWERQGQRVRNDLIFGVDGRAVATKYIIELFSDWNCPTLEGKPRLFFFQACRGSNLDPGQEIEVVRPVYTRGVRPVRFRARDNRDSDQTTSTPVSDQTDGLCSDHEGSPVDPPEYSQKLIDNTDAKGMKEEDFEEEEYDNVPSDQGAAAIPPGIRGDGDRLADVPVSPSPIFKDFLVMYATPPGYYAWRRTNGAWFIQSLCRVLNSDLVKRRSLVNCLTVVCAEVARNYESQNPDKPSMHQKKTIPVIETMLVKDVIFKQK